MRRALEIVALILFLAGLELAAGSVSHTLDRFEETFRLAFAGDRSEWPPPTFLAGATLVFLGGLLGGPTLWARRRVRGLQFGTDCPLCGGETERVKRRHRHRLLAAIQGQRLTRRQCTECTWGGLSIKY